MPGKKYRVRLSPQEREELEGLVSRGRSAAYKQTHARIVLMSDERQAGRPMKDEEIAQALKVGRAMVERVRRRCVEGAWNRKTQLRRRSKKLDGEGQRHLIAMACSEPRQGRTS